MTLPALPAPLRDLATPALLADQARLERNLDDVAAVMRTAGVGLRPHFKTSKCLEVARRQLDRGAVGFTCATMAEVALLVDAGVQDILWAHQPVGRRKVNFAVDANRSTVAVDANRGTVAVDAARADSSQVTVAIDSVEVAGPLSEAAAASGVTVPYLIEVETGTGRAGVVPDDVVALADRLATMPGLRLRGVFTHEGAFLVRHLGDRPALEAAARDVGRTVVEVAADLRRAGHDVPVVSVGSTPGLTSAPSVAGITEARPGTYVYYDANQVNLASATVDQCALTVLTRVVSRQRPGVAIVDAGIKALSSDGSNAGAGLGIVCDAAGTPLDGVSFATAHEEHGFLRGPGVQRLAVGELLRVIPNHACGAVNMWSGVVVLDRGIATEHWGVHARY